jgi:hypothetical protein
MEKNNPISLSTDYMLPTSPEGIDTLGLEDAEGAVDDTLVGLVQAALLDHLVLVLDEELHPLDGSSGRLGHAGRHAGQHEVLDETKLLLVTAHLEERIGLT